jgi:hypothetical protein
VLSVYTECGGMIMNRIPVPGNNIDLLSMLVASCLLGSVYGWKVGLASLLFAHALYRPA